MLKYLSALWQNATQEWLGRIGDWRTQMIGYIVQSAVLFLVLFFMPILGNFDEESRLALAGALAVIASAPLLLVWDFIGAPYRIHKLQQQRIAEVENAVASFADANAVIARLSELYGEGRNSYDTERPRAEWERVMQDWEEKVLVVLREYFDAGAIHSFRRPGSGFAYNTKWRWPKEEEEDAERVWTKAIYSGRLHALDDLIQMAGAYFTGDRNRIEGLASEVTSRANRLPQSPLGTEANRLR
jgi:hypothetical protein